MHHFARPNFLNRQEQIFSNGAIIPKLIFGNAYNYHSEPEFAEILLKLKLTVDRDQHVEHLLSSRQ